LTTKGLRKYTQTKLLVMRDPINNHLNPQNLNIGFKVLTNHSVVLTQTVITV